MSSHRFLIARLASTRSDLSDVLDHLADSDMTWSPAEGANTICDLLCEIARKDHEIVSWLKTGAWPDEDPDPFDAKTATVAQARAGLEATRAATIGYISALSEGQLDEIVQLPERWWEALRLLECPRSEMLRNISAHEWYHTGQIISYLWTRGQNPNDW